MKQPLHGVAHIRVSVSPVAVDGDFYAVFVNGQMLPIRFTAWNSAYRHFRSETGFQSAA